MWPRPGPNDTVMAADLRLDAEGHDEAPVSVRGYELSISRL